MTLGIDEENSMGRLNECNTIMELEMKSKKYETSTSMTAPMESEERQWVMYDRYPLLRSLLQHDQTLIAQHKREGRYQADYPKSNTGWMNSLFTIQGRALDLFISPWLVSVFHATLVTALQQAVFHTDQREMASWEVFFALVLNSSLAFLLVFRLNRAAGRYWTAREYWGIMVAKARCFLGTIIQYGDHDIVNRDHALRWMIAFNVAAMELLRGLRKIPHDNMAGILSREEVDRLNSNRHAAIYAIDRARFYVRELCRVDENTPAGIAILRTRNLNSLEQQLNTALDCCGGLERIRGTPLPMVYVAHLRTFLLFALGLLPYVWGPSWGWFTIPMVAVASYAWLGIEGAAMEAEAPFGATRVNALDMHAYCLGVVATVKQELMNHANDQLQAERERSMATKS